MKKRASGRPTRPKNVRRVPRRAAPERQKSDVEATPVTAAELRALRRELERKIKPSRMKHSQRMRWNPEPEDVQRSVAQLVLTLVEFLRKLMERQAIRRMEQNTLTDDQIDAVGTALMNLEKTVRDMGARFGLTPEDLNLDLGPVKLM